MKYLRKIGLILAALFMPWVSVSAHEEPTVSVDNFAYFYAVQSVLGRQPNIASVVSLNSVQKIFLNIHGGVSIKTIWEAFPENISDRPGKDVIGFGMAIDDEAYRQNKIINPVATAMAMDLVVPPADKTVPKTTQSARFEVQMVPDSRIFELDDPIFLWKTSPNIKEWGKNISASLQKNEVAGALRRYDQARRKSGLPILRCAFIGRIDPETENYYYWSVSGADGRYKVRPFIATRGNITGNDCRQHEGPQNVPGFLGFVE